MAAVGIGIALLLVLAVDVFSTVFLPRGRGGPLTRRQNRAIWAAFRACGTRRDRSARDGWLALAGPAMVVTTVTAWVFLLVVAFAFIHYPWMDSFLVSPGGLRTPWVEALYYSGYTAATLGFGDVVADLEALRLLAPVEAFSGFALLSVSVTYFLAVYRELIRKQALAARIAGFFRANDLHAQPALRAGDHRTLARWGESVAETLTEVLMAHFQYPVLHYFRSPDRSRALPVQLGHLIELRGLVQRAAPSRTIAALARHPSHRALQDAVGEYLREVDDLFVPSSTGRSQSPPNDRIERAHRRLLDYMLYVQAQET